MDDLHIRRHDRKLVPEIPERSLIQFSRQQTKEDAVSSFIKLCSTFDRVLAEAFQFLLNLLKGLLAIPHFLVETILR